MSQINNQITVVIAAGGHGSRFGSEIPKQFALLDGKPVMMHTLEAFYRFDSKALLIVSLHSDSIDYWKELLQKYNGCPEHIVVEGGKTRFHSIKNALAHCPDEGLVLIHDAVRPLISSEVISRVTEMAHQKGNAIPVMPVIDSVRLLDGENSSVLDRRKVVKVQTPQGFRANIIKEAYQQEYQAEYTDDASVVEATGKKIFLVDGSENNIKITVGMDLMLAEAILMASKK
ncbi:MAG: 2-C-methyl-D-erythritol 4-phosphate cytidylyltransferase [Bacteroidetes bacterium HGW-Bacteroidetes-21]|jgi:2-C-methyl-D-erythritol 4-phosphate cytidylyltransferase|nr:MAG: 2-C-methyl-D-erythritol 4-phosphate cytidylyltransferase [Bacteroidetes bacterium HGW-Bacteroidetes-21]